MEMINLTGTSSIDWPIPQGKSLFKTLTSEKMQRRVRAIVLFLLVLVLLFTVGMIKTIQISLQLAYQEFELALQDVESVGISNAQESEPVEEIPNAQKADDIESTPTIVVAVRDTRVRSLRKEASQQGIRNVSRMSKAELLIALQISGQVIHPSEVSNASDETSRCSDFGGST